MSAVRDDLALEYRLTVGVRAFCECAPYFMRRGKVLLPEVQREADRRGIDAVDLFAAYARGVHQRHDLAAVTR